MGRIMCGSYIKSRIYKNPCCGPCSSPKFVKERDGLPPYYCERCGRQFFNPLFLTDEGAEEAERMHQRERITEGFWEQK